MENHSNSSDMKVLGSIADSYSKTLLGTLMFMKIKSKETPKQGITVVVSTTNQSMCSHKSSIMCVTAYYV